MKRKNLKLKAINLFFYQTFFLFREKLYLCGLKKDHYTTN